MRSKTLNKIITEEIEDMDFFERIQKMSLKRHDNNMEKKLLRMPLLEIWEKSFPRSKEEIQRYNKLQEKKGPLNKPKYAYDGYNFVKLGIVLYDGNIPNGCIKLPEEYYETFKQFDIGDGVQPQIILGEEGIIFRYAELPYECMEENPRAENKFILGNLSPSSKKFIIGRSYETVLKNTIRSFLDEPNDFSENHFSHTTRGTDNHAFHYLVFVPKSHLSFDNWWKENGYDIEKFSEKNCFLETPLIYETILKKELEKANYERKKL